MTNKTISINPSLFNSSFKKTKKKDRKQFSNKINTLISPNVLKNKLLKRIKEHKQKETENLENNKIKIKNNISDNTEKINTSFSDEFNDSLNYLQTLALEKKIKEDKINNERKKKLRQHELERKTVKNYQSIYTDNFDKIDNPMINIELPEELNQPLIPFSHNNIESNNTINLFNKNQDTIPFGILKGGLKPTYREWNKTQRNLVVTDPNASLILPNDFNKSISEREYRLKKLRDKIKLKNNQYDNNLNKLIENNNSNTYNNNNNNNNSIEHLINSQNLIQPPKLSTASQNIQKNLIDNIIKEENCLNINNSFKTANEPIKTKRIIKKTIKKKYTLGKSQIKRTVGILLKDRFTRKKIINAQKELKRKPINDIKKYLRDHNLIKIGCTAPNDIIRQIYESSMLAGEITNKNEDTLLYNISRMNKED
jgi:hypothetical protein